MYITHIHIITGYRHRCIMYTYIYRIYRVVAWNQDVYQYLWIRVIMMPWSLYIWGCKVSGGRHALQAHQLQQCDLALQRPWDAKCDEKCHGWSGRSWNIFGKLDAAGFSLFILFLEGITQMNGRQNFHYQKAVLEGPCELHFNKKIAFPNQPCAHAFVGGPCFCRTFESYKNQVSFCREHCFLVMQNHEHKSPHFVADMLVK